MERLAIAIRTRSLARIFSTSASITAPGCSTSSGAAPCAAITGKTRLMEIGMAADPGSSARYPSVVNPLLTAARLQRLQYACRRPEIEESREPTRRDFLVHAPLFDVPVLVDMGGGPD